MKMKIKVAREYSREVIVHASEHGQRTGQYLFNGLPEGARDAVAGMLWDPFYRDMSQYQIEEWILDHLVLSDSGTVTGVITGGKIIWGSR